MVEIMENFSNQRQLRLYISQNKDLTGVNFSNADIRGIDFTDKILTQANFSNAQAGISKLWLIRLIAISAIIMTLLGIVLGFLCASIALISSGNAPSLDIVFRLLVLILLLTFIAITVRQGLGIASVAFSIILIVLIGLISLILKEPNIPGFLWAFGFLFLCIIIVSIGEAFILITSQIIVERFALYIAGITNLMGTSIAIYILVNQHSEGWTISVYLFTGILLLFTFGLSVLISWQVLNKKHKHYSSIYDLAVEICSWGGTRFQGADLSDADFTNANLKYADFRKANLTRTCWLNARQLDIARVNQTYLENRVIRQLVVNQYAKNANFDNIKCDLNLENATLKEVDFIGADLGEANLKGVTCIDVNFNEANLHNANLKSAKLQDVSLMGADLSQANLKNADLSGAKLVRTQLYEADLTGANLTGAFIQDWGISDKTKLDQIKCKEIFMQLPIKENKYDPCRKPDEVDEYFQEGDFIDFITPLRDTLKEYHQKYFDPRQQARILDLPHRDGIDSLAAAITLKELTEHYPKAGIEVVSLQGGKDKIIRLQVKISKEINRDQFSAEYRKKYHEINILPNQQRQCLLVDITQETSQCIRSLGNIIDTVMTSKQIYLETNISFLGKKKILFLIANPQGIEQYYGKNFDPHRFQEEIHDIQDRLDRAKRREQFKIIEKWAVRTQELQDNLNEEPKPQIVHFLCYGVAQKGLALENDLGEINFVNPTALAYLFEQFKNQIECVLLNVNYSEYYAEAVAQHIDYVIGIKQEVSSQAAITFSVGFYTALGAGKSISEAYKQGLVALCLDGFEEESKQFVLKPEIFL